MSVILYALLAWFLYQFIFRLVIPVYLASRKIKKGFREMHEKMNPQQQQQTKSYTAPKNEKTPKPSPGDYIEFEEIKE